MAEQPLSGESRERLAALRDLLLEQHKLLLDRERAVYEQSHGPIAGPGALLKLVIEDPHFAWLRQLSALVAEVDEALSRRGNPTEPVAEALIGTAREIMTPGEDGDGFQARYHRALKEAPEIGALQGRIAKLLGI
jgi:hypothetical protein